MAVTEILALHMCCSLKSRENFCKDYNGSRGVVLGAISVLSPPKTLPGKRLTRRRVAATRLGPATGSQNGYTSMRYHLVELSAQRGSPATP